MPKQINIQSLQSLHIHICAELQTIPERNMHKHIILVQVLMLVLLSGLSHLGNIRPVSSLSDLSVNCIKPERESLLRFKAGLTDPSGLLSSWVGTDCCKWRGVVCNNKTGRVLKLKLRNPFPDGVDDDGTTYSLGGEISPSLLDLKYLKYLDLSSNDFQGIEIPKHFGALKKLRYLNLSRAGFGGTIPPEIGNLTSLYYLDLCYNEFNRWPLPDWLFKLSKLAYLDLSSNNLLGPIPDAFGNMTSLQVLHLSVNVDWSVEGRIPISLTNLCNLRILDLSGSNLYDEITGLIDGLSRCDESVLETLNLGYNQLHGFLPDSMGYLKNLRYLDLQVNSFVGTIPHSVGKLSFLKEFYLTNNNMNGPFPTSLGQLSSLVALDISENSWEGVVTESHFANLVNLKELSISKFSLSPQPPLAINISTQWLPPFRLQFIKLRSCQVGPQFPAWLRNQNQLKTLILSNTGIVDTIPEWLSKLELLETLDLSRNQLHGPIPPSLASLTSLTDLDLSYNNFSGRIPTGPQFARFNNPSIYGGNPQLCGPPLVINCTNENASPPASSYHGDGGDDDDFETLKLLSTMAMGFALGFWGVCGTLIVKKTLRHAFFRFVDDMKDTLYVLVTVNLHRLWRIVK